MIVDDFESNMLTKLNEIDKINCKINLHSSMLIPMLRHLGMKVIRTTHLCMQHTTNESCEKS